MDPPTHPIPYSFMPHLSHAEKWNELKPVITHLYITERRKLADVVQIIKDRYGFDADENQYRHQVTRKWKLKKSIPQSKQKEILQVIDKREALGKRSIITHQGQEVDKKKLRRSAKMEITKSYGSIKPDSATRSGRAIHFPSGVFRSWNMPYWAWRPDQLSPGGPAVSVSPPSDIVVTTPASVSAPSPVADSPSGLSKVIQHMNAMKRAFLFAESKQDELVKSMKKQQQIIISNWLYQFWFFSFKTAKNWGKGPRRWTADVLGLDKSLKIPAIRTPGGAGDSPDYVAREPPATLCRWGVHVAYMRYEAIRSPPIEEETERDEQTDWPSSWRDDSHFPERLRDALESNSFSNMDADSLPVALPEILRNAQKEPNPLDVEAFGFSIMGRNTDLLEEMCKEAQGTSAQLDGLYPFHLATAYLSGTEPCCNVLDTLVSYPYLFKPRRLYVDDLGHSVLDNLMIAVLKSHTSCMPGDVNDDLKRRRYFVGEEVDICGRWDADSECIRTLFAHGECRIPFEWKHKFCHTAAQVICHSIDTLFAPGWSPNINIPSGLFVKRCTKADCGLKLQLFPLHTLVMTAFQLVNHGCKDEDLFGMVACLLCLLSNGANPLLTSEISLPALLKEQQEEKCDHEPLTPLQLAERIDNTFSSDRSDKARTGWEALRVVLRLACDAWTPKEAREQERLRVISPRDVFDEFIQYEDTPMAVDHNDDDEGDDDEGDDDEGDDDEGDDDEGDDDEGDDDEGDDDEGGDDEGDDEIDNDISNMCYHCENFNHFRGNVDLSNLWAAAQAELLTYRPLRHGDPWTSSHFRLDEFIKEYRAGRGIRVSLVDHGMLTDYCPCGRFCKAKDNRCACASEVSAYYFCNLEEWARSIYLRCPVRSWFRLEEFDLEELQQEEA